MRIHFLVLSIHAPQFLKPNDPNRLQELKLEPEIQLWEIVDQVQSIVVHSIVVFRLHPQQTSHEPKNAALIEPWKNLPHLAWLFDDLILDYFLLVHNYEKDQNFLDYLQLTIKIHRCDELHFQSLLLFFPLHQLVIMLILNLLIVMPLFVYVQLLLSTFFHSLKMIQVLDENGRILLPRLHAFLHYFSLHHHPILYYTRTSLGKKCKTRHVANAYL
mmetsp:Transcript_5721/g.8132  ORF Transcript_5721/g.8132 Transcript_5721/m.8132 type:complete len:216 (+) Transcript_5721:1734-2381(+)